VEGVKAVAVDFETRSARVVVSKGTDPKRLIEALAKAGYADSKEKL